MIGLSIDIITEGALLALGIIIVFESIIIHIITGKPRLRFVILLDLSLLFWIGSFGINLITSGPHMSGTWKIVSLMGMTMVLFAFIAAFVDYIRVEE